MWKLDCEESWAPKNWCFWTVVLEKTLESPLDCKEIQPVHPKGDQSWVFIGRTDDEAEAPILWPPHVKSWLIGKDWCWEGLGAGGEGDYRGWDGWMASLTRWTWVWVNSRSWWCSGRPGMLWFMGSQRVGHDWAAELTELNWRRGSETRVFSSTCDASERETLQDYAPAGRKESSHSELDLPVPWSWLLSLQTERNKCLFLKPPSLKMLL